LRQRVQYLLADPRELRRHVAAFQSVDMSALSKVSVTFFIALFIISA
jgi:hypothetical protein